MVAITGENVIGGTIEFDGSSTNDGVYLGLGRERKALQDFGAKGAARRLGLRLGPVYACYPRSVMSSIRVFLAVDNDPGMEERGAEGP